MASPPPPPSMDPRSGFCSTTKTFHSLRPPNPLPPLTQPLSVTSYVTSHLPSPLPSNPALIDSSTDLSISFPQFLSQIRSLASSLRSHLHLSKGQVAFILSPTSPNLPILYLALLSLGVVISPSNPLSSPSEISHQLSLTRPCIAFSTSSTASNLPPHLPTILIDSDLFRSFLTDPSSPPSPNQSQPVFQTDPAAILFSSGTTGRIKGVALSHRNFIALMAGYSKFSFENGEERPPAVSVALFTIPLFHIFGMFMFFKNASMGYTTVLMERFEFGKMLRAVERYKVTTIPVSPPLVVAMAKVEEVKKYDLSSLQILGCGGAPLGKEVAEKFKERFPNVEIVQVNFGYKSLCLVYFV